MTLADVKVWQAFQFVNSATGWRDPKVRVRRSLLQYSELNDLHGRIWFMHGALHREVEVIGDMHPARRPN